MACSANEISQATECFKEKRNTLFDIKVKVILYPFSREFQTNSCFLKVIITFSSYLIKLFEIHSCNSWRYYYSIIGNKHWVKSVRTRSFSGPYFPAFGMNTERYSVYVRIESESGKIWTRKSPDTVTFHAVKVYLKSSNKHLCQLLTFS